MSRSPDRREAPPSAARRAKLRACSRTGAEGSSKRWGRTPSPSSWAPVVVTRSRDTQFPFRQDSDFLYLTGFDHPGAVAVLRTTGGPAYTLYVEPRDREMEIWNGYRPGVEGARRDYEADEAHPSDAFRGHIPELVRKARRIYHVLGRDAGVDARLIETLDKSAPALAPGARSGRRDRGSPHARARHASVQGAARARHPAARRRDQRRSPRRRRAPRAARRLRVRARGRAAARLPPPRRERPRLHADRRQRQQRHRAALRAQRPEARRRRAGADRRRLRARGLRLRRDAHLPGRRPLQRPGARPLRGGARRPDGGDRALPPGRDAARDPRRQPCAGSSRACSRSACCRATRAS